MVVAVAVVVKSSPPSFTATPSPHRHRDIITVTSSP
jgi:hypothetical protein